MTAYFDATYNHPKADLNIPPVHTVAAYVATKENWRKFRKEWRLELAKKGLEHFHMTDFEYAKSQVIAGKELSRKNQFYGWSKDDFVPFLQRLHRTINRKSNGIYRLCESTLKKAESTDSIE